MGTYQNSLEAVENEMKSTVDALYGAYLGKLEDNRQFLPDLKAKRDHEATSEYIAASTAARARPGEGGGRCSPTSGATR